MNVDATVPLSQKPGTAGHGIFFGQTLKDDKEENEDIHEKGNVVCHIMDWKTVNSLSLKSKI